jgi:hypothetical protein
VMSGTSAMRGSELNPTMKGSVLMKSQRVHGAVAGFLGIELPP